MISSPCLKCGAPAGLVEVQFADGSLGHHLACQKCFDEARADLEEKRRQFDELIAAGVSRSDANDIMIARIRGETTQ